MEITVALVQFESAADPEGNRAKLIHAIDRAKQAGADLVTFHEIASTPYFCYEHRNEDRFSLAEPVPGPTTDAVAEAARASGIHVVLPMYEAEGGRRFNTAVFIDPDSGVQGKYQKTHVPISGDHDGEPGAEESFYFSPGETGFQVWESSLGLRIGVLICFDRHFPEGARAYALQDVDLIVVPTASYRQFILDNIWEAELVTMAFQNNCHVAGINKIGEVIGVPQERRYPGRSVVVSPEGRVLARAGDQEEILLAPVVPNGPSPANDALKFMSYRRPSFYHALTLDADADAPGWLVGG